MIRVVKSAKAPDVLITKGKAKRREHVAAHNRGDRAFDFDAKIYRHKTVKAALINAQHDKCFLCESKITHISHGDVEHFRPKAGYCQNAGEALHTPGYYWLAYEWNNLFLACQLCNQVFKRNLFPLADPKTRATSHRKPLNKEAPLFLDPSVDDPEKFISFRKEIPYPIGNNPRGKATITGLGLTRLKLNERRLERYDLLQSLYEIANMKPPLPESARAQALLAKATQDSSEHAGMARAAVAAKFALLP